MPKSHLIGEAAVLLGLPESRLRSLCNAGVVTVPRAGRVRVFPADQLPAIRHQLEQAGHLPPVAAPTAGR